MWSLGTLGKLVLLGVVVKGAVLPVPTWELPSDRQEAGKSSGMLSPEIPMPLTAISPGTWPMCWWTGVAQGILTKP